MSRDRAAYMREYRAKRKARLTGEVPYGASIDVVRAAFNDAQRIVALEDEVARLKRELATRPGTNIQGPGGFNTRPFTPVPKPGK